uniref:Ribosomal protein L29 n=1 Tax=Ophidocladus simpliciusculus TaxID=1261574 RepID=A0A1Z1MJH7_9FLOR|nr:ribosomal protein L29 [Ophidocladus simpliciusculus]ARW66039.1 ribosomal protein L29 [Ophidocladus simpliciusculus]
MTKDNKTNIEQELIQLRKQLILLNIKKITKQKIETQFIKKTKHKISQMLTLITLQEKN